VAVEKMNKKEMNRNKRIIKRVKQQTPGMEYLQPRR
jgi:hypothetical protein